jgi:hypothetical protein
MASQSDLDNVSARNDADNEQLTTTVKEIECSAVHSSMGRISVVRGVLDVTLEENVSLTTALNRRTDQRELETRD